MAMYLGSQKVSPSLNTVIEKITTITQDTSGNVISQNTTQETNSSYVAEDPDNLAADLPVVTEWSRPADWPDLDVLPELDEGVYLTYDNTDKVDYPWACFYCDVQSSGQIIIAQGHINGSNFVQDASWTVNTATYKEINYGSSSYDYVIFKITPALATKHMTSMYFGRIAQATLGTFAMRPQYDQYCLERRGRLPYLTSTAGSGDNIRYCTQWMEYDNTLIGENNRGSMNLAFAWYRARSLQKINFNGWPTSQWNVTSLESTFNECMSIKKLDLSSWDTINWHVASLYRTWYGCYMLRELKIPFNTINWGNTSNKTINFQSAWDSCYCLEELDLSSWDVSNLVVTTLYATWSTMYQLKSLNIKNWDTSKWTVNSLYCTWYQDYNLVNIDLSGWNTSNWKVGRIDNCWYNNLKRRNFKDIENWNTSGWSVVQMGAAFYGCTKVQEINLNSWNTSNWKVNGLSSTWANCYALRHLHVNTWNTSNWVVTTIGSIFSSCINLEEIEAFSWDTSNWPINVIGSAFNFCCSIKELDLTQWNTTKWNLDSSRTFNYFARYCRNLKYINVSNLNLSDITLANYGSNATDYTSFYADPQLETLILPSTYAGHLNFRYNYSMTRKEIVRIFNALPTALSGAKIIITELRYKLTNADIAIATNKGYTVS